MSEPSAFVRDHSERIQAEGATLPPAIRTAIADRFRQQIGGAYELIAARIEMDHP